MGRELKAHNAGYDAYLRQYGETRIGGESSTAWAEEPHGPYVEDVTLYSAWLEGWADARGRCRRPNELARSIVAPIQRSVTPALRLGA
jgi:hypothetical protein